MSAVTQAEFARQMNWNRSSVTRAKIADRLVMEGELVNVEASLARLEKTAERIDVSERHAQERAEKQQTAPQAETPPPAPEKQPETEEDGIGYSYQAARAVKERYAALQAKADYETCIGKLLSRDVVDFVLSDYAATLRSLLETRADRLAPVVHPLQSMEEVHAALAESDEEILREMDEVLKRKAEQFTPKS